MPKVGIIILNWNNYSDTKECLMSLQELNYKNYFVIVIDNGSIDGSTDKIKNEFPDYFYIYNKENLGYSGGNNVGIRFALEKNADLILILNNDTIVTSNLLSLLIDVITGSQKIGMVGPRIYSYYDPLIFQISSGEIDMLKIRIKARWTNVKNNKHAQNFYPVSKLPGSCLLIKREVIQNIGLMDENYFLYYADTDMQRRARKQGWLLYNVPHAKIYHKISATIKKDLLMAYYYDSRDFLYYVKKNYNFIYS